jgi:hypothetical protein
VLLVLGILCFLVWLVFIKRWGGTPDPRPPGRDAGPPASSGGTLP